MPTIDCCGQCQWGIGPHSLGSPAGFKDLASVAHSQAMWPHPWHLKHHKEPGSFIPDLPLVEP